MKKYISREVVEAKQLTDSDKDGMTLVHMYDVAQGGYIYGCAKSWYGEDVAKDQSAAVQLPYLSSIPGLRTIYGDGDYLVKDSNGGVKVIPKDTFESKYAPQQEESSLPSENPLEGVIIDTPGITQVRDDLNDFIKDVGETPLICIEVNRENEEVKAIYNLFSISEIPNGESTIATLVIEKAEITTIAEFEKQERERKEADMKNAKALGEILGGIFGIKLDF